MNYENWWLLALPTFFLFGWLAARIDIKQLLDESQRVPSSYVDGINYLLKNDTDRAIDVFVELASSDPESIELQFAVGALFRQRGEMQRALLVHQALLDRPDLSSVERNQALLAVGQDYLKSGMHDRAEQYLKRVDVNRTDPSALRLLIELYVTQRDWESAIQAAMKYQSLSGESQRELIAHFMMECAEVEFEEQRPELVMHWIDRAESEHPNSPRALIMLGKVFFAQGKYQDGLSLWKSIRENHPDFFVLVLPQFVETCRNLTRMSECLETLKEFFLEVPCEETFQSIFQIQTELSGEVSAHQLARELFLKSGHSALIIPVFASLKGEMGNFEDASDVVFKKIADGLKTTLCHKCESCGFEANSHYWRCPACQSWDTYSPIKTHTTRDKNDGR
jgi:lipopolysaccharide biosynthesis regulator YciM